MFKNLNEEIKRLNSDVKTVANCKRAKSLRNKLLGIGLPMAIIGFGGAFTCFILFATAGFDAFSPDGGFTPRILIPFILLIPCALLGSIGTSIARMGFNILVTAYTTDLIDETVGNRCPACNESLDGDENFCSKCGAKIKNECPHCHEINDIDDKFCKQCGTSLR